MKPSWSPNLEPKCRLQGAGRIELWEVLSRCSRASAKAPIKQFEASFAPRVLPFPSQQEVVRPSEIIFFKYTLKITVLIENLFLLRCSLTILCKVYMTPPSQINVDWILKFLCIQRLWGLWQISSMRSSSSSSFSKPHLWRGISDTFESVQHGSSGRSLLHFMVLSLKQIHCSMSSKNTSRNKISWLYWLPNTNDRSKTSCPLT